MANRVATTKGFTSTGRLLTSRIRKASESRGFAESKLLTRWTEIAGDEMAAMARPVDVRFGKGGMGATLTLLTTGTFAPLVEMQKELLREKVNSVYGYSAISRIRITQTAATGFAEGQVAFETRKAQNTDQTRPATPEAIEAASHVSDDGLRAALERLGTNIQTKAVTRKNT